MLCLVDRQSQGMAVDLFSWRQLGFHSFLGPIFGRRCLGDTDGPAVEWHSSGGKAVQTGRIFVEGRGFNEEGVQLCGFLVKLWVLLAERDTCFVFFLHV